MFHLKKIKLRNIMATYIVLTAVFLPLSASAETLLDSTIADARTLAFFKVNEAALKEWLPDTHEIRAFGGPYKGANILMMFIDRMLHQDAEGKSKAGGAYRMMALVIPGKNIETGKKATFISRVYAPSEGAGTYKVSVPAIVSHSLALSGTGAEPLSGRHDWNISHDGGEIAIGFDYKGAVPKRKTSESILSTPADASVARIYRYDQLTDVMFSPAKGIDRTSNVTVKVSIPELTKMFDGTATLIGLSDRPFYTRTTYKP